MPNLKFNTSIGDSFQVGKDVRSVTSRLAWSNAHTFIENEKRNTYAWSDTTQEVAQPTGSRWIRTQIRSRYRV